MSRKKYHYFTLDERRTLYRMNQGNFTSKEMAHVLGKHVSSIYRELKRGCCTTLD